ncbi:hypothetical protein ACFSYG_11915 [Leeuwenhoekiella polynyae]|uniref:Uncharacterized protein n=1 Tax=Leeuwenhoekiella polynyae TaxID=1550906 RepID=A0A4Q0PGF3_9FLAO|nr:hypothetical protein [Leeuwenhoekiella polynyae]RXG25698.1 hypothetical protein DSM02_865 [Leeuwenhoekiella polynyae]
MLTVIGSKIVKQNEKVEMNNWIDARFENRSTKPVFIFNRLYEPKEIFFAGVSHHEVSGSVEIEFDSAETQKLVLVTYGAKKDCN